MGTPSPTETGLTAARAGGPESAVALGTPREATDPEEDEAVVPGSRHDPGKVTGITGRPHTPRWPDPKRPIRPISSRKVTWTSLQVGNVREESGTAVTDVLDAPPPPGTGTDGSALLLLAHGSIDPQAQEATRALAHAVGLSWAGRIEVAYLRHARPTARQALHALAETGHGPVVVVPLLLLRLSRPGRPAQGAHRSARSTTGRDTGAGRFPGRARRTPRRSAATPSDRAARRLRRRGGGGCGQQRQRRLPVGQCHGVRSGGRPRTALPGRLRVDRLAHARRSGPATARRGSDGSRSRPTASHQGGCSARRSSRRPRPERSAFPSRWVTHPNSSGSSWTASARPVTPGRPRNTDRAVGTANGCAPVAYKGAAAGQLTGHGSPQR
ncbi:sirohydrochlorin chelatase [Streptomyces sp. NPDC088115]|uniref:sirohydrochlorin chelatase n=1 Tax=Streptomyces sp. NPDC088115 TaxID=3365824 RepID=UPI00382E9093